MRWSVVVVMLVAVIAGCATQPLPTPSPHLAAPTPVTEPSAVASQLPSMAPSEEPEPPTLPPEPGYIGMLTRYCDLGVCCPAIDVAGTWYSLRLQRQQYRWRPTESGYVLRDRQLAAVVATEGTTVFVRGVEAGPDFCFAAGLEHSIEAREVALAYVGAVLRVDVCLVLSTEHGPLEMKFPEGWDLDLVDGRMVVRDAERATVMGEGDRVAVIGKPEREATGSFCMVGDDIIRVARVVTARD